MMSGSVVVSRLTTRRGRWITGALAGVIAIVMVSSTLSSAAAVNSVPTIPDGVTATSDGATITVSWNPSSDVDNSVDGYNIYIDGDYKATEKGQTFHTQPVGDRSGTLAFQVTAFDDGDPQGFSPMSEIATVDLGAGSLPDANGQALGNETDDATESTQSDTSEPAVEEALAQSPVEQTPIAPAEEAVAQADDQDQVAVAEQSDNGADETAEVSHFTEPLEFRATQLSRSEVELRWTRPQHIDVATEPAAGWMVGYNIYRDGTYHSTLNRHAVAGSFSERFYRDDISALDGVHTYYVVPFVKVNGEAIFGDRSAELTVRIPLPEHEPEINETVCPDGLSKTLIVAGDSWADRVGPFLSQTFRNRGWVVHELGVGSTLSRDWLPGTQNLQRVVTQLEANVGECTQTTVSLSVGGNDLVLPEGGANAFPQNAQEVTERLGQAALNIISSIDAMRAVDPDVRIVLPGYDLLNPNVTAACLTAANVIAGQPGQAFDPARTNDRLVALRGTFESVARARPGVVAANLLGTTQGRPGNPDFNSLPPVVYSSSDCIHLTGGPARLVNDGIIAPFAEPFGFNGYEIWGAELAMVIDPTVSLTYKIDLSADPEPEPLADPFGEPLEPEGGLPQDVIVFEAEDYTTRDSASWGRGRAEGATGTSTPNAVVSKAGEDTARSDGGRLRYEIPITTDASYDLWIRRRATTSSKDQLTWGFDGMQQPGEGLGGPIGSDFSWVYLGAVDLDAGVRVLDLGRIEGQLVIDRLALLRPGMMPLGDGGPANLVPRRAISADPGGNSLTIDYNRLYVADAGEEGGLQNGDEPRLVVIEFRSTPGVIGSTVVTNSFRYRGPKGRDDGDTWQIPDDVGRFEYDNFIAVNERDLRGGQLPELIGHLVVLLEDEPFSSSPVRDKLQKVADELERAIATVIEPLDPVAIAADPKGLAASVTEASGLVVDASKPYNNPGISDTLESAFRDIGGADVVGFFPMFFLSVDESLAGPIDAAFAEQLQGVAAAGGALRDRSFQFKRRGSGATYVVDVEVKVGN